MTLELYLEFPNVGNHTVGQLGRVDDRAAEKRQQLLRRRCAGLGPGIYSQ